MVTLVISLDLKQIMINIIQSYSFVLVIDLQWQAFRSPGINIFLASVPEEVIKEMSTELWQLWKQVIRNRVCFSEWCTLPPAWCGLRHQEGDSRLTCLDDKYNDVSLCVTKDFAVFVLLIKNESPRRSKLLCFNAFLGLTNHLPFIISQR